MVKDLAGNPATLLFSWSQDNAAQAGYKVYMVFEKEQIVMARAPWAVPPICVAPDHTTLSCSHDNALLYGGNFFYNIVGICPDGTEGP